MRSTRLLFAVVLLLLTGCSNHKIVDYGFGAPAKRGPEAMECARSWVEWARYTITTDTDSLLVAERPSNGQWTSNNGRTYTVAKEVVSFTRNSSVLLGETWGLSEAKVDDDGDVREKPRYTPPSDVEPGFVKLVVQSCTAY